MKKIIILMLLALIATGMAFAAETDSITTDISLTVDPQIIAHKQADIVMNVPVLDASDAGNGALAEGAGSIGYFDSNASTTFSFQASALDNEASGGDDVMTTRYVASFSGFGGDAVAPYESGDVENPDLDDLEGTRTIVPHSGRIDIDLYVEADVEWEDDAGLYGSQFVVTAVVN
ncbi:MAG: hypothetical protein JEZ04_22180 [Spirochaetales bacterium]|nr:hypothetical protein [Spirochaetales bacterium]